MSHDCKSALLHGYERMAAWSDLLDQINVFPVADADTGRNLRISLAPLRRLSTPSSDLRLSLVKAATGNSGNIAAAFFEELVDLKRIDFLPEAVGQGARKARQAVVDPQPGTMLDVFDALAEAFGESVSPPDLWPVQDIVDRLQHTVANSKDRLPVLRQAGVVDAGALGMFLLLEAFLNHITGGTNHRRPVTEIFRDRLTILTDWQQESAAQNRCVNATLKIRGDAKIVRQQLATVAESVITTGHSDHLKVHLHTADSAALRGRLEPLAQVVAWSEERIAPVVHPRPDKQPAVHLMTDAAGSMTADDARRLGITLLDSYLVVGDEVWPETLFSPQRLYEAMANGVRVSTAQASLFERHQSYLSAISRFDKVLYLCVGSVYTGNFDAAVAWSAENDIGQRMAIIDTGAASGRLGIAVEAVARYAERATDAQAVIQMARQTVDQSQELVFLDQLKFLAAGGRVSKVKGFLGDLLGKKPIISPTDHGAAKVAVVRSREEQLAFGLARLQETFSADDAPHILLQYSDNRAWVGAQAADEIKALLPSAELTMRPLSLTSGAHMGPGTWALAYLPAPDDPSRQPEVGK